MQAQQKTGNEIVWVMSKSTFQNLWAVHLPSCGPSCFFPGCPFVPPHRVAMKTSPHRASRNLTLCSVFGVCLLSRCTIGPSSAKQWCSPGAHPQTRNCLTPEGSPRADKFCTLMTGEQASLRHDVTGLDSEPWLILGQLPVAIASFRMPWLGPVCCWLAVLLCQGKSEDLLFCC